MTEWEIFGVVFLIVMSSLGAGAALWYFTEGKPYKALELVDARWVKENGLLNDPYMWNKNSRKSKRLMAIIDKEDRQRAIYEDKDFKEAKRNLDIEFPGTQEALFLTKRGEGA